MKIKIFYFLPFCLLISLLIIFLFKFNKNKTNGYDNEINSPLIGEKLPSLEILNIINKEDLNIEKYKGKKFVINFFASWCLPCKIESPNLIKLSSKVPVIGILYKDNEENMVTFLNEYGNPYDRIGIDKNGSIAIELGVYGVPETFLISKNGMILHKHAGPITYNNYKNEFLSLIEND